MATPEELRREQEINRLRQEGNQAERIAINLAAQLTEQARGLTEEIKEQYGFRTRSTEQERAVLNLSRQITKAAQQNVREIRQAGDIEKDLAKVVSDKLDTERELAIARKSMTDLAIREAESIANLQKDRLGVLEEITKLEEQLRVADGATLENLKDKIKEQEDLLGDKERDLERALKEASVDVKRLALAQQLNDQAKENIKAREAELDIQKKINKNLKISGGLISGLSTAFSKLGIGFNPFKEVEERMEKTAEAAAEGNKRFGRTRTLIAGIGEFAKQFLKTIISIEFVVGSIVVFAQKAVRAFLELNAKAVEFGRLTGRNIELESALNDQRITAVEYVEAAVAATNELGLSASGVFGPNQIAQIGEAVQLLGLSAEQATNLALRSEAVGMSLNSYQDGLIEGINAANKFTESAVAPGIALRDIADISEDISLSLQNNPVLLGKAAVQARALGLSLKKVDDIAGGLLDFESSIEAELEAQLLTGRALNLSKAREFALMNDMEGVAREIANQGITAADFAGMNRLAQESLAQALGMSRQELAKTLQIQSMSVKEQEEANRLAMAQQSLQDQIRRAVNALQLAFAPLVAKIVPQLVHLIDKSAGKIEDFVESTTQKVTAFFTNIQEGKGVFQSLKEAFPSTAALEPLIKIGEVLGKIVGYLGENPKALNAALLVFGTTKLTGINVLGETLKGLGGLGKKGLGKLGGIFKKTEQAGVSSANNLKNSFGNTVTSIFKTVKNVATELAKTLKNVATEISKGIGNVLTNIGSGLGKGIGGLIKGIASGLASLANPAALIGLGAITLAIIGFATALRIAGPALEPLGKMLKSAFEGIAQIVSSIFTGVGEVVGKIGETITKFQEARTAAKTAKIEAATAAVKELADIDGTRFNTISAGIRNIATALTEFSNAISGGLIFGGIDVKEQNAQVNIFSRISNLNSEGLTAAGTGINNFTQAISNASLGNLDVGKLKSFIDQYKRTNGLGQPTEMIQGISKIGTLIPTMNVATNALNGMATAVMSLATALKAITTEDIQKIQDLVEAGFESDTRSTFEIIAEPVNKLAKVLGGGEEGDAADIVAKLDELISVVKDGGNVYMDSRWVGATQQMNSSRNFS